MRPSRPPSPFTVPVLLADGDWRDVHVLSERELAAAGGEVADDLLAVWVRRGGRCYPVVLTGWRQDGRGWTARLQASPGEAPVWVRYRGVSLVPIQPQDFGPAGGPPGSRW